MTDMKNSKFVLLPIIAAGAMLVFVGSQPAWASDSTRSPVDLLVGRIKTYIISCEQVISRQPAFVKRCADEKTKLLAEQKNLGVSDKTIDEKLNRGPQSRGGWRWP